MGALDGLSSFLFKYRPGLFAQGRVALRPLLPEWAMLLGAVVVAGLVVAAYLRATGKTSLRDRVVLGGLRLAALALLGLALLRPTLLLSSVVPQRNYVGILIDDSRSMRIADASGRPRADRVGAFTAASSPIVRALRDRFQLRYFRFSTQARRLEPDSPLAFAGADTRVARALDAARADLGELPLSGLVLVTDGADNDEGGLTESLLSLKAAGVPVFTVGVGQDRFARDLELGRVSVARSVLRGTALDVELVVTQTGLAGRKVPLQVEDGGRIVARQEVELPPDGEPRAVRVSFTLDETGPRRLSFRVPVQDGELIAENNEQQAVVDVRAGREKILYFEGEPRWEMKFLRRAVAPDSNLQLVTLERTARNKFLRLDVDSAGELAGGFPATREELFRYRALILGSVEASYFTHDQLQMIAEFVSQRGGSLLVLGGRLALAEGGWAGTPVAEALPVELDPRHAHDTTYYAELRVRPTRAGLDHPALHIAPDSVGAALWERLPPLSSVNQVGAVKPGATVLLEGREQSGSQPVLAYQRFGRGLVLALPVQDTWMWQMHADMPAEDQTHERLWRQLLRWLVADVPDRVLATTPDRASPGEPVTVGALAGDARFLRVNDRHVAAHVLTPSGQTLTVPLDWTVDRDGEYRGSFVSGEPGLYEVRVASAEDTAASAPAYVQVAESRSEYFGAQRRDALLRRIARETGGRYYDATAAGTLPEDLAYAGRGLTVPEERDLWDMPGLLLALVGLLGGEWIYRRKRGLA
jgi:uncharacterized membrane protein